jgi:diguanylate cyclase (GGDEF)-like protein
MVTLEHQLSFETANNLNNQKKIISTLTTLKKDDVELALIQFNGKSIQLHQEIEKLYNLNKYNFSSQYIFGHNAERINDLQELSRLTTLFNDSAHEYYIETNTKDIQLEEETQENLSKAFSAINNHINSILLKNISFDQEKFKIIEKIVIFNFTVILIATIWYRKSLYNIYKDLEFLYQIDKSKRSYEIFSSEADAISLRMNRKNITNDNPSMLDPVTEINNHKGMLSSYSSKKGLKDSNFTSVTIFEIDNFSKSKRTFSQELTQAILKKVAYTISLHEQPVDVIARTDYNQFTLILSRPSKEQSFKDVELIRQSIGELKFNIPEKGSVNITVSGGFIIKPNNTHLDEAIKQAKEILQYSKTTGRNRVLQTRDMAEKNM